MNKAREAELIAAIIGKLDPSQRDCIRAQCANMRNEFRVNFEGEISPRGEKSEKLAAIEQACQKAARGVATLQDEDWLPRGRLKLPNITIGSTDICLLLQMVSEAAGEAAKRVALPDARSTPKQDATAHYAYMLMTEFPPRARPQRRIAKRPHRAEQQPTASDDRSYAEANWPRLSPAFRAAHNELRQARGLLPIPPPEIDLYTPPQRGRSEFREPSYSPKGPFVSVATLLFEYFTGIANGALSWSCRKVIEQYQSTVRHS
jgi:hypothetical protein